jgi:MFS family permease
VVPLLGGRRVIALGMAIMTLGLLGTWFPVSHATTMVQGSDLVAGLFIYGLGEGFVLPTLVNTVLHGIQSRDAGSIAGVFTTMQQISGAIGVAIIGILFFGQLAAHTSTVEHRTNAQNYADAFAVSLWYTIGLLLISFVLTFWLPRQLPAHQPGMREADRERE